MTRSVVLSVVLLLGAYACVPADDPVVEVPDAGQIIGGSAPAEAATPTPQPTGDGAPQPGEGEAGGQPAPDDGQQAQDAGTADGQPQGGQPQDGQAQPAEPQPAQPAAQPIVADARLGDACRPLLQPQIPSLVVEVAAQAGAELSSAVVDHLTGTLAQVAAKPGGVSAQVTTLPGEGQPWTLESVRELAAQTRQTPQTGDRAVIRVLALRGEPDQGGQLADAIGVAFNATEFAVFPDRIEGLSALIGGRDAVLRAVTVHELGHLLCLVNLNMTSPIDHADPDHPTHSRNRESVMYYAIETTAIGQLFTGPPPDTFDADDLADLQGLREGRL